MKDSIPPWCCFLVRIDCLTKGIISSLFLSAVSKSVSLLENKQFLIFPSAVNLILLQVSQKGFVTELIIPNEPSEFAIL